ncbi:hypothetical protein [Streptococcus parauberis]|uniref:hypothetical protein n=1 Tax=Streptococcus parauberis TaxID=1348 RepID=UPI003787A271
MDIKSLLQTELLGNNFLAINDYEETFDFKSKEPNGYKIKVSIQDSNSIAYMELITVKIKNLLPTLTFEEMKTNKQLRVVFKNLKIGVWNNQPTFSADDMLPYLPKNEGK